MWYNGKVIPTLFETKKMKRNIQHFLAIVVLFTWIFPNPGSPAAANFESGATGTTIESPSVMVTSLSTPPLSLATEDVPCLHGIAATNNVVQNPTIIDLDQPASCLALTVGLVGHVLPIAISTPVATPSIIMAQPVSRIASEMITGSARKQLPLLPIALRFLLLVIIVVDGLSLLKQTLLRTNYIMRGLTLSMLQVRRC